MVTVKKMKDDGWMHTWYMAQATKMGKRATGATKEMAVINLKNRMRDALKR